MEIKQPLLSICIPTYNRANVLKDNLDSLVRTEGFSDEVEVIISDNCSTDETKQIGESFAKKYSNIKYFRNNSNVGGCRNVLMSLEYASGSFLKLVNDYTFFCVDGISYLLKLIKDNLSERPVIFFHYGYGDENPDIVAVTDANEVVLKEGSKFGWLSNFGYWKKDFSTLDNFDRKFESLFPQIDWFFRLYEKRKTIVYCQKKIFWRQDLTEKYKLVKENYDYIRTHGINYINLLNDYVDEGMLGKEIIESVKKSQIYPFTFIILSIKIARFKTLCDINEAKKILKTEYAIYPWYTKELVKSVIRSLIIIAIQKFLRLTHLDQLFNVEKNYTECKVFLRKNKIRNQF